MSNGVAVAVSTGAGSPVVGTDTFLTERYFFKNNGYSDQIDHIEWSGATLMQVDARTAAP